LATGLAEEFKKLAPKPNPLVKTNFINLLVIPTAFILSLY
jgi:hypothetical protein